MKVLPWGEGALITEGTNPAALCGHQAQNVFGKYVSASSACFHDEVVFFLINIS